MKRKPNGIRSGFACAVDMGLEKVSVDVVATPSAPRIHRELCYCGPCRIAKRKAFEAKGKKP